MIPIYKPYLTPETIKYAHDAIDSGWISSQGKYITIATEKLKELLNVQHLLLTSNGTVACHLIAKALKYKHPSISEIIVPNNVYVAAINAFLFDGPGAWKVISVEADQATWNYNRVFLDIAISEHPNAAVLLVHNMGGILNQLELQRLYPKTIFVEDACEALFGRYENQYAGTASFVSAFSTFANKTICSGEGGFLTTTDQDTYDYLRRIHSQGQSNKRFVHSELGYNYRMTNVQAALLYGQLEVVDQIVAMKEEVFGRYRSALEDREDIKLQKEWPNTKSANWMFGVRIPKQESYQQAENFFRDCGIEPRPLFYWIGEHSHIANNKQVEFLDSGYMAKELNNQCLILPSYPGLTTEEQGHILSKLDEYVHSLA